jgi:hypothetical protein
MWRLGGSLPPEWVDECRDAAAFYFWVKSQDHEQLHATTHKGGLLSNKITISFVRLYIKHSCCSSGTAFPNSPPLRLDLDPGPHVPRSSSMKTREGGPPFRPWRACAMNMFEVWTCFHSWVWSLEQQVTRLHFPTDSIPPSFIPCTYVVSVSTFHPAPPHPATCCAAWIWTLDPTQESSSVGRVFDSHVSTGSGH